MHECGETYVTSALFVCRNKLKKARHMHMHCTLPPLAVSGTLRSIRTAVPADDHACILDNVMHSSSRAMNCHPLVRRLYSNVLLAAVLYDTGCTAVCGVCGRKPTYYLVV